MTTPQVFEELSGFSLHREGLLSTKVVLSVGTAGQGCSRALLSGATLYQLNVHSTVKNLPGHCCAEDHTVSREQKALRGDTWMTVGVQSYSLLHLVPSLALMSLTCQFPATK